MILYSKIFRKNIVKKSKYSDFVESLNNHRVEILPSSIKLFYRSDNLSFSSTIKFTDEDSFTKTSIGEFEDGAKFRFIQPQDSGLQQLKEDYDCEGAFSIASIDPQGFAIHFLMVKDPDSNQKIDNVDASDLVYRLIDASIMAFNSGLYAQSIDYIKKIAELDPEWKITLTHSKARNLSEIINYFQRK